MKFLNYILITLCLILCSCNHSEEPPAEVSLPIERQYRPATVEFQITDEDFVEKVKEFDNKDFIVRSVDELPDDPLGFSEAYRKINFNQSDLFIAYRIYRWDFESYVNRFYRNRIENKYNWEIHLGVAEKPDTESTTRYFNRFAIKVKKLPENADVKFWISLSALNWDWDEE